MRKRFLKKEDQEQTAAIAIAEAADEEVKVEPPPSSDGEDSDDDLVIDDITEDIANDDEDALEFEDIAWDEDPHEEIIIYNAEDEYEIEEYTPVVAISEAKQDKEEDGDSRQKYAYEEEKPDPDPLEKVKAFLRKLNPADYIIGVTGIFVIIGALITGVVYTNAQDRQRQLAAYADLGKRAAHIELIGRDGLEAIRDAQIAKRLADEMAANAAAGEETQPEEDVYEGELTYVAMDLVSVYRDLKIKFRNEGSSKLIPNIPFEVQITDPYNNTSFQKDDGRVGVIHLLDIPAGSYQVAMVPNDATRGYAFSTSAVSVTVSDTLEYRTIDVSDEIKKESEINAALEDSRINETVTESVLVDTVEWVEASRTLLSEDIFYTYEEIDKSTITDPTVSAVSGFQKWLRDYFDLIPVVMASEPDSPPANPDEQLPPTPEPTPTPHPATGDTVSPLVNQNGERVFVMKDNEYVGAVFADYFYASKFYLRKTVSQPTYRYTGWQEMDGKTYYYDKDGNMLTGDHVIRSVRYRFGSDGALVRGNTYWGIDVSKWNATINWNAVKSAGAHFVIIRVGYRGSVTGAMVEDPTFKANVQGALAAGLKVGVYFFSQATNEVEAIEEASMAVSLIRDYNITYPVFLDVEATHNYKGRADHIGREMRTNVCKAFARTVQNAGYTAGIYANKDWFTNHIYTSELTQYVLWMAQYAVTPTYTATRYDMWQYSSKGSVPGITGNVDLDISYLGY